MKKRYTFSFDEKVHADVVELIEGIPKTMRSQFIVDLLRLFKTMSVEEKIKLLQNCKEKETKETEKENNQPTKEKINLSKLFCSF